jgi:hypothetical protein
LRDEPMRSRRKRRGNEVPRPLASHAGVALRPFSHLGGIKTGREISQLMHHDIRARNTNGAGQRRRVEHIDHHGLDAGRVQRARFGCRAGGADDVVPRLEQEGHEALADGAGSSGQEDFDDCILA